MIARRTLWVWSLTILLAMSLSGPVPGFSGQTGPEFSAALETKSASDLQVSLEPQAASQVKSGSNELIIKTYTLKHIKPEAVVNVARLYDAEASFYDNVLTVKIWSYRIPAFEELLKKLDVEKKAIQFQVYAVVASRDGEEAGRPSESRSQAAPIASPGAANVKQKAGSPGTASYSGAPITLKFNEADLRTVVLYLAGFAHLNVVFDPDVRGVVTCNLENIPWDQALDIILAANQMGKIQDGNTVRIAPLRVLAGGAVQEKTAAIENKDLKRVLDELKALWNFRSYEVDGPSFVTVKEDSGPDNFKLVTNRQLNLIVSNAKVVGDEPGKRTITVEQLKLTGMTNFVDYVFVDTHDVSIKENGYLVAGVSGFGSATKALILVISAVIKQ